jgi:competence protein ComEC
MNVSFLSVLAAGTAAGYYGFTFLYGDRGTPAALLFCLFVLVLGLSFFRVLGSWGELHPLLRGLCDHRGGSPQRSLGRTGLLFTFFSVGLVVGIGSAGSVPRNINLSLPGERINGLRGILLDDPRTSGGGNGMAYLALDMVQGADGVRASAKGKVLVFFPPEHIPALKEFGRKSALYVEGRFVYSEDGRPPFFLSSGVHVVRPAPPLEQLRTGIRLAIAGRFAQGSAQTGTNWGGMALALFLGVRDDLDGGLARSYRDAGASHVLALSGMHLAILSSIIAFLLRRPLGLKVSAAAGAVLIVLYVSLVGPQPSLLRAAVMYLIGTIAIFGGLKRDPLSLLSLAFLVQIILWPESGATLSFILSYLALWGILQAAPLFHGLFRGKIPESLLSPLSASLGAFLATSAVTTAFFGVLRPIGIVAGLLIVPVTTVFMIGSLIWLALSFALGLAPGILSSILSLPLAKILSFLYRVLEWIVSLAARAPGFEGTGWIPVLALSLVILCLAWYLERRRRIVLGRLIPLP